MLRSFRKGQEASPMSKMEPTSIRLRDKYTIAAMGAPPKPKAIRSEPTRLLERDIQHPYPTDTFHRKKIAGLIVGSTINHDEMKRWGLGSYGQKEIRLSERMYNGIAPPGVEVQMILKNPLQGKFTANGRAKQMAFRERIATAHDYTAP